MCDACSTATLREVERLPLPLRVAVKDHIERMIESASEDGMDTISEYEETIDDAHGRLVEIRDLLAEKPLDQNTEISELFQHIENYHRAIKLIDELLPRLERTV